MLNGLTPLNDARKWSHDVRNAFNCIRLCTSAFNICPDRDEQLEMLGEIDTAAERTIALIDSIPAELVEAPSVNA